MTLYCITGIQGYLGRLLARRLTRDPNARVFGIDLQAGEAAPGVPVIACDIRAPEVSGILAGQRPGVVIHLACYTRPEGNAKVARSVNIEGTRNLVRAITDTGVQRLVLASSAAAYGSHDDNPVPLAEDEPLRPNADYYYSLHKAWQERIAEAALALRPELELIILRPATILGPMTGNTTSSALRAPLLVYPRGPAPPIQLLAEDDAIEAFHLAATGRSTGIFNIGASGTLSYPEMARLLGKRILRPPYPLLAALATLGWRLRLSPVSSLSLRFIRHPIVLDGARFEREFGFRPRLDTRQVLQRFAAATPARSDVSHQPSEAQQ